MSAIQFGSLDPRVDLRTLRKVLPRLSSKARDEVVDKAHELFEARTDVIGEIAEFPGAQVVTNDALVSAARSPLMHTIENFVESYPGRATWSGDLYICAKASSTGGVVGVRFNFHSVTADGPSLTFKDWKGQKIARVLSFPFGGGRISFFRKKVSQRGDYTVETEDAYDEYALGAQVSAFVVGDPVANAPVYREGLLNEEGDDDF